jgi:hypothetical protein
MVHIDSVKFGEIKVGRKDYYSDVIVWWDGKVELIAKTHQFGMDQLLSVLKKEPEAVVIGTGLEGAVEVLEEVQMEMEDRELPLLVEKTQNALQVFNGLVADGKKAAAYIHVTS